MKYLTIILFLTACSDKALCTCPNDGVLRDMYEKRER